MTQKLSEEELQKLKDGLALLKAGQPALTMPSIKMIEEDFCKIWPIAEPIIRMLPDYLVYIPSVGSGAAAIVKGLDQAGNALAKSYCKDK